MFGNHTLTNAIEAAIRANYRHADVSEGDYRELAKAVAAAQRADNPALDVVLVREGKALGFCIDQPDEMRRQVMIAINQFRKDKMERLVEAIGAMNPHEQDPDIALKLYDVMWAAICHQTGRAGRFYDGDTPESRLYQALGHAFYVYGKAE